MTFFLLSWSCKTDHEEKDYEYSELRDREVCIGRHRVVSGTEAQLCRVELLPNDKKHPELRVASKGEEVKFDITVEEYDLLEENSYNREFLVEVDADGNVVSIHDSHRPPKIIEEGAKGHRTLRTDPRGYHEGAKGVVAAYTARGDFKGCYERLEGFDGLYEFVEELVNS